MYGFRRSETDGLCLHSDDVALLVASSEFPDGHVRFALAHELGHHLFDDPRDVIDEREWDMFSGDVIEKRVNAFAGHLLMPADGIGETLRWISSGVVNERALVALMERFGVSLAALIYQLNVLRLITFEQGAKLRDRKVSRLVTRHRDVASTGAATTVRSVVRAPERLVRSATQAAKAEQIGLPVVAALLERDDDNDLWRDIMEDDVDCDPTGVVPVR